MSIPVLLVAALGVRLTPSNGAPIGRAPAASPTREVTITTAVGAGADAHVTSTTPNDNFGDLTVVAVKNDSGTGQLHRKGYFRLDLASLAGDLRGAELELTYAGQSGASASTSTYDVWGLLDGHAGEGWLESEVTWSDAPANAAGGQGLQTGQVVHLGEFTFNLSMPIGTVVQAATPGLLDYLRADTDDRVTFIITRRNRNLANEYIASKEDGGLAPLSLRVELGRIRPAAPPVVTVLLPMLALRRVVPVVLR